MADSNRVLNSVRESPETLQASNESATVLVLNVSMGWDDYSVSVDPSTITFFKFIFELFVKD